MQEALSRQSRPSAEALGLTMDPFTDDMSDLDTLDLRLEYVGAMLQGVSGAKPCCSTQRQHLCLHTHLPAAATLVASRAYHEVIVCGIVQAVQRHMWSSLACDDMMCVLQPNPLHIKSTANTGRAMHCEAQPV